MATRSRNMQIISVQKSKYERKMKTKKDREEGDEDGKFVAVSNCLFVLSY